MAQLVRTEHDHQELSAIVASLRAVVDAAESTQGPREAYEKFAHEVERLVDGLVVHFDREEQGLFPFIARELPDALAGLERLESAHDEVCGSLLRISSIVKNGPAAFVARWASIVSLFRRFDAVYVTHARDEVAFLRELDARLKPEQRSELADLLEGI